MRLPPLSAFKTPRAAATAILALGGLITAIVNFPGVLSYDSYVQLLEGRSGSYANWHPPVMSWMLGIADAMRPGAAYFVLFDTALAFASLIALLWLARRVSWLGVAAAAAVLFLPQLFLLQAAVLKDVLFADASLAGFVCLAHAAQRWPTRRLRFALLGGCAVFLTLAALTRQNGAVVVPCAAVGLAFIALQTENSRRLAAVYGAGLLAGIAVLVLVANAALDTRWDGSPSQEYQFKILQIYDLTGMAKRNPAVLRLVESDLPELARAIEDEGVRLWSPLQNDTLEVSPRLVAAQNATPAATLRRTWLNAAVLFPGTYLAVRAELFRWVFQPPDVGQCHPYLVGESGDPADLKELGMRPRYDRRDAMLNAYGKAFVGTPVFSHAAFGVLGAIVFVLMLRRRRPADLAVASMIAAAFVFAATFFVISIACDYRYLYALDLSALAAALYLLADPPKKKGA
jgi:hypothetical protein